MSVEPLPLRRKSPGLGRGLSALLGEVEREPGSTDNGVREISIADISPHPNQPRRHFDDDALGELAESIALRGVLQPIVVRPVGNKFEIVAGERRWRAAQQAQLHQIPAIIRNYDDSAVLEVALIENIQREELNAIEEGEAYARLTREFGHSQEALGKIVHKSRSHIANLMRLLDLPPVVREMLSDGRLQMGHARALLGVAEAELLAQQAVAKGLSVRDVERLAKKSKTPESSAKTVSVVQPNGDIAMLERQLGDLLGLKVLITYGAAGGEVTISYATLDQLDMICQRLSGEKI